VRQKAEKKKWWSEFWTTVAVTLFVFWFGAVLGAAIVLPRLRGRGEGGS
jgi:ABC-type amino acid transport system permease subunit